MRLAAAVFLFAALAVAAPPEDCHQLRKHGKQAEARACYEKIAVSRDLYLRAEGLWGLRDYNGANEAFKALVDNKAQPNKDPKPRVRWGEMYLEKAQPIDAAKLFEEALQLNPKYAPALLAMGRLAADGFDKKAVELANEALAADPKLTGAHELLASLALEDSDPKKAIEEADKAIAQSPDALDAMAVRATIELLDDRPATAWFEKIYKVNPVYGEAHAIAAHHLVLNRRYDEGIAHYRKAIELDPQNWPARSKLGINLMRVGQEEEARKHLEACYNNGFQDSATRNTLTLMDSYKNFVTFKTDKTILRLDKKEAELLRIYFEDELTRAIATYEKKYKMKLPRAVQLEVYPDHEDFAVRTMGMPGLGALGVTFGDVVAMDSPSGRKPGSFHWAYTLWHELSHVFVLTATKYRVPRWFTEGMAVHEESATTPEWGDPVTPEILMAIKDKKLLPVAELDRGFIRPSYPSQVIVSYFQAGRICDYINQKWGFDKLLAMMHAFAARKSTPEVIEQELAMKPEKFDEQFLAWVNADLEKTAQSFEEWRKRLRALTELVKQAKHDDVIKEGEALRAMYPDYVEGANPYEFVAEAHLAKGNKKAATAVLAAYASHRGKNPDTLKKLAGLQEEAGDTKAAAATLAKVNFIYPVNDEGLHRKLGDLLAAQGNWTAAAREYRALVASKPIDVASAHFNLARAYSALQREDETEEQLLLALEAAPGYRPAQKLLLELNAKKKEKR